MVKKIVMPAAGQTTDAATVTEIKVKPGDRVKRGDVVLMVETDKASLPIESVASGIVCTVDVEEFEKIDAGSLLMTIGSEEDLKAAQNGSAAAQEAPAPAAPVRSAAPASAAEDDDFVPVSKAKKAVQDSTANLAVNKPEEPIKVAKAASDAAYKAMPSAKKAAAELNVKLENIIPSNGEFIKKSDVESYAKSAKKAEAVNIDTTVIPTSRMQDSLASKLEKLTVSSQCVSVTANAECAVALAEKLSDGETTVTAGDLVMLALARLSTRFPLIAARNEKGAIRKAGCSFGLAYCGINGTVSATCADADKLRLTEIAAINHANPALLEKGDMTPCGANTLTVFDLSASGTDSFIPTVMSPEIMSVGIGGIKLRPVVCKDGTVCAAKTLTLTLAYDCRVLNPGTAAAIAARLAALIEEPALML